MTHNRKIIVAGLLLAGLSATPALADETVATVNGVAIKASTVDFMLENRPPFAPQGDDAQLRAGIIENLVTTQVLVQAADKAGIAKQDKVKAQLEMAKDQTLARAYVRDWVEKHPVSEEDLKKGYEDLKKEMGDKEYKVRHILVETEAEATDVITSLKGGAKFPDVAKEKSKDGGSKNRGGDLGWIKLKQVVQPFGDAVRDMKKGSLSEVPVESQFGFHVIEVEDTRPTQPPSFDEVKDGLRQRMEQEKVQTLIEDLRAKAKVDIVGADKPAKAAPAK